MVLKCLIAAAIVGVNVIGAAMGILCIFTSYIDGQEDAEERCMSCPWLDACVQRGQALCKENEKP